ncbi:MAG: TolB family protein [Anaerolineae bacterium]
MDVELSWGRRRGWHALGLVALAVVAVAAAVAAHVLWHGETSAEPIVPEGLAVARRVGRAADVVAWDGQAWQVVVPPAALPPVDLDEHQLAPTIRALVPAPGHDAYALLVLRCVPGLEETGGCTAAGEVYDVRTGELTDIDDDPVAPIGWLDDQHLVVAQPVLGQGAVYDLASGTLTTLPAPDREYTLPRSPDALSAETGSVAFSSATGEGLMRLASGATTWLGGVPSSHNTPWLAIAPTSGTVAAVRIAEGRDNPLGAGTLTLHDGTGRQLESLTPDGFVDHEPAWSADGELLAFLRTATGDVLGVDVESGDDAVPPTSVVVRDVGTGEERVAATADAGRQSLLIPGAGLTAVFLQDDGDALRAFGVDTRGGQPSPLGAAGDEHTALGWAAR